jgi:hypothetical protein
MSDNRRNDFVAAGRKAMELYLFTHPVKKAALQRGVAARDARGAKALSRSKATADWIAKQLLRRKQRWFFAISDRKACLSYRLKVRSFFRLALSAPVTHRIGTW